MKWLTRIFHRGEQIDREIDEELRFHIEQRIERYIHAGMTPEQARRKALDRFGNFEQIREAVREIDLGTIESVWQDVRYAARTLAKSPGFTAVALLSLTLGIGLNSAIFSAINAVLLRPLPYKDPERIVQVSTGPQDSLNDPDDVSPANYFDYVKQNQAFESMALIDFLFHGSNGRLLLKTGEASELVQALRVSATFFPILGVQPSLGRTFLPDEDRLGANVAVISSRLWRRRFAADPQILGRNIRLNDGSYRVIGVMPEGFRYLVQGLGEADLWLPNPFESFGPGTRRFKSLQAIAKLKPGVSLEQARADMRIIAKRLEEEYPRDNRNEKGVAVVPLLEVVAGQARPPLLLMLGAVRLVLLIACANVANLLLARAGMRKREMAIRTAIGAGRPRLIRQLLTESVLLALAGGLSGLTLAYTSPIILKSLLPDNVGLLRLDEAGVDLRVLALTLFLSLLTGVVFGLAPALHASKCQLNDALKDAGRSAPEGRSGSRLRSGLVILQVALSLVLLAGAGLMINSFWRMHQIHLGFVPEHLLVVRSDLPKVPPYVRDLGLRPLDLNRSNTGHWWILNPEAIHFGDQVIDHLNKLPGVESAAEASGLPMVQSNGFPFRIEGQPAPSPEQMENMNAWMFAVTPDYFRTMGMRFTQGRGFSGREVENTPGVAIINQTMAQMFWTRQPNVIGQRITFNVGPGYSPASFEIVGVADDVRVWPRQERSLQVYVPRVQCWRSSIPRTDLDMTLLLYRLFVVRSRSSPAALAAVVRGIFGRVVSGQPAEIQTMDEAISTALWPWRSTMLLLGLFAGLAVLLSAIGIYGVISYTAIQRTHEIGIRMAMGAGRGDVLGLVMKSGLLLALAGIAIGSGAAYWLTRLIANQLYGVTPTDPVTFASVALVLLAVALVACYLPARRTARLDPMAALRCE
jgi:hypothetical protein